MLTADISNLTGDVGPALIQHLQSLGVKMVIVASGRANNYGQQAPALAAAGFRIRSYVYIYPNQIPAVLVQDALRYISMFPANCERLYVDWEDRGFFNNAPAINISLIQQSLDACGNFPRGIYTGAWFWLPATGNTHSFQSEELWFASYDSTFNPQAQLQNPGFGGWDLIPEKVMGRQFYVDNALNVDYSVFKEDSTLTASDIQQIKQMIKDAVSAEDAEVQGLNRALVNRFRMMRLALDPDRVPDGSIGE